jgi:hypothetical protein
LKTENEEVHDAYSNIYEQLKEKNKIFTIEHTNALNKMFIQIQELCVDLDKLSLALFQSLGKKFACHMNNTPLEKEFNEHSLAEFESTKQN